MDDMQLLIDFHKDATRQGPGSDVHTRLALTLSGVRESQNLKVADIGCGTGAQTRVLAHDLNAHITAVDFLPAFLTKLEAAAAPEGVADRITTLSTSMDALPFAEGELDMIWSEGAIYNMGFENGVKAWRRHLKPGGILAVSELTWLTDSRPAEVDDHWQAEYPEIDTGPAKLAILQANGYVPIGYFVLPESCWINTYYQPMEERFEAFLADHNHSDAAQALVASEQAEIALYKKYKAYFSYGFYIARKEQ